MGVRGEVVYLPDFDGVHSRVLGDRLLPPLQDRVAFAVKRAQEGRTGTVEAGECASFLVEGHLPRVGRRPERRERGQRQPVGGHTRVARGEWNHDELHDLACHGGVRCVEIPVQHPTSERLIGALVDEVELRPNPEAREVDDDIGPLGQAHEELTELHGSGEKAALGADLPEGYSVAPRSSVD
jgi:hypothetical protein